MSLKTSSTKKPAEQVVKDIRCARPGRGVPIQSLGPRSAISGAILTRSLRLSLCIADWFLPFRHIRL
jgi:hypothetical protein